MDYAGYARSSHLSFNRKGEVSPLRLRARGLADRSLITDDRNSCLMTETVTDTETDLFLSAFSYQLSATGIPRRSFRAAQLSKGIENYGEARW